MNHKKKNKCAKIHNNEINDIANDIINNFIVNDDVIVIDISNQGIKDYRLIHQYYEENHTALFFLILSQNMFSIYINHSLLILEF